MPPKSTISPRVSSLGPEPLHQRRIIAVGDEADVLAVGLGRDFEAEVGGDRPDLALGQAAQGEAQEVELLGRRPVEEIALVAARVGALVELGPAIVHDPPHIMASRQAIGAELAREGDQVGELHALVAQRARHRRPAVGIFVDEAVDHAAAEATFVIEHVMGDAEPVGDRLRIVNVLPGAARPRPAHGLAMIVQLERDPDHLGARVVGERGGDRAVDAAGHGDDDARLSGRPGEIEHIGHLPLFTRISLLTPSQATRETTEGAVLARHEPDFQASADIPLSLKELLALLAQNDGSERERQDAIACYLSASDGWADAVQRLGGNFANEAQRLKERKAD